SARHPCVARTLITRPTKSVVQLRFHEFLDEPPDPIPDSHLDRIKPPRVQEIRRHARQLSAILLHGVISSAPQRRIWLVAQAGDYTTLNFHHFCDGASTRSSAPSHLSGLVGPTSLRLNRM